MFVYESVPGTAVFGLAQDGSQMSFRVEERRMRRLQ